MNESDFDHFVRFRADESPVGKPQKTPERPPVAAGWLDMLFYRLWRWRWNKLFRAKPLLAVPIADELNAFIEGNVSREELAFARAVWSGFKNPSRLRWVRCGQRNRHGRWKVSLSCGHKAVVTHEQSKEQWLECHKCAEGQPQAALA